MQLQIPPLIVVIKIGTSSLSHPESGYLQLATIAKLVEAIVHLRREGHSVVLVSSGAVGIGCGRLGLKQRPRKISKKQAIAAVGQGRLIRIYDDFFGSLQQPVAQVLLTRGNLIQRQHYMNVHATFHELLELGVVPIVNENDTVAVDELKFGDNDTLSALVASLIEADWLFLLTDVDRLYSDDPRQNPDAQPIEFVEHEQLQELRQTICEKQALGTGGTQWGTGGMTTKLDAARIASAAGVKTVITRGDLPERIAAILNGEKFGTQFAAQPKTVNARKRWIAYGMVPLGKLFLDDGAVNAVVNKGRSLLPAGITQVEGKFEANESVSLCDRDGKEVARGISNYSSSDIVRILGSQSEDIPKLLGFDGEETVIHRDNLVSL
ncbi:MAG: glutamate 5-kinase [Pseudanabaena sp. M158S2SP1A06QC]|jgi:glutamate 5-kinase|uniref:glutamate 5-kinase n=1 Tax=Pseudanabaena mucicola TaxID=71190 RepID=UPI002577BE51|nr:glutamate 5-kinase [Pseudanabaena mucicola]MCA6508112.1 glutamate 5-kinase [Pseudanabaena sp. M172S2SP2A07QC]MCA6575455.1 glutamate 5-kinase [Pseudanabaena sp. M53BS1SP1A06MG]MCA6582882.1 glutamate 5-kinase [Pseudanabaena sp. M34BS1SP1A06MG]MCA6594695.1 glutamate 5-kinase [Pseudanabaena sp. M38BS1SP1A06MG]MCA6594823.1 glutamate 5-kinase [Pseudanabaena sp. M046S1SP1A06QC]MCA6602649.1 glutamate 5-kinase [Pseudanabaena sp. M57BS1SP1A06MG]MCA6612911.1 glutamate 5-kinase [Pseudanabaena sp. M15